MSEPKASWDFGFGEIVDGYAIEECLGGGSEYEVYAATVLFTDGAAIRSEIRKERMMVLKFLRPDVTSNERSLRRLRREAALLERVEHPSVVKLVDAVPDGPRPHLVLERLAGSSMRNVLRAGPMPTGTVVEVGAAMAGALAEVAARGIVHLDVKPSNVILGARPTLIDFSIARDVSAAARLTKPVGTDLWMAPEQCEPAVRGPVGPAADVWGLGATLWRALLGKSPFKRLKGFDRTQHSQRFPQLVSSPRALRGFPAELVTLLAACLDPTADARPTAVEVSGALAALRQPIPA